MKATSQPEQSASLNQWPKSCALCMLSCKFPCNVNDTRAMIGLCTLLTSRWCQIRDPWHVPDCSFNSLSWPPADARSETPGMSSPLLWRIYIIIGLSLYIHSFLSSKDLWKEVFTKYMIMKRLLLREGCRFVHEYIITLFRAGDKIKIALAYNTGSIWHP